MFFSGRFLSRGVLSSRTTRKKEGIRELNFYLFIYLLILFYWFLGLIKLSSAAGDTWRGDQQRGEGCHQNSWMRVGRWDPISFCGSIGPRNLEVSGKTTLGWSHRVLCGCDGGGSAWFSGSRMLCIQRHWPPILVST